MIATLLLILNLAACFVVVAASLFFYLRHSAPHCMRHHVNQIALIAVSVGFFAAGVDALRGTAHAWWAVAMHVGVAMFAGKAVWDLRWRNRESVG